MDIILESHSENWGILYVPRKPEQLYAWHIRWRPSQPCEPRKAVTFNKHLRCSILWIFVIKTLPIKASALYWELQGEANWSSVKLNMFLWAGSNSTIDICQKHTHLKTKRHFSEVPQINGAWYAPGTFSLWLSFAGRPRDPNPLKMARLLMVFYVHYGKITADDKWRVFS